MPANRALAPGAPHQTRGATIPTVTSLTLVDGGSDWLEFATSGTAAAYVNADATEFTFEATSDGATAAAVGSDILLVG